MKCVFVGDLEDDAGFVAEVLQEKGIELIEALEGAGKEAFKDEI